MISPEPAAAEILHDCALAFASEYQVDPGAEGVNIKSKLTQLGFTHSFISGPFVLRARQPNQALLKACNNKKSNIENLLDLTAGWGVDSLTLAYHGQRVTLLEQHPLVFAIVAYSLDRLAHDGKGGAIAQRLVIQQINANDYMRALETEHGFDCIYLDPMFPVHKSTAKPGKELQILQAMTENLDIDIAFATALQNARKRVVVKRPAKAATLSAAKPDLVYREKTIRFDVYLTA
jgi:16S rRNA (guanine1516-N2)-methyltransferase